MKNWFCPNCKRRVEKPNKVIVVLCRCGHYMTYEIKCLEVEHGTKRV
jgi:RNase P subunit RPR2